MAALEGEEVFPVPVDVFENGFYPMLGTRLLERFRLPEKDFEGLLRVLGACIRWGRPLYVGPKLQENLSKKAAYPFENVSVNIWGTCDGLETYSDEFPRPLGQADTIADVEGHNWPDANWFDYERLGAFWDAPKDHMRIEDWAVRFRDYARHGGGWNPVFSRVMDLFGMETGLVQIAARPDLVHTAVAYIGDFLKNFYTRLAHAGRGHFDILGFGDDFASQRGMLISPTRWREYFLPLWKSLFEIAHQNGMKAGMHSCGSVRPVLGDLIDAGLDILEVVQITAAGMDPVELKREYGSDLAFYGGIDTQQVLPKGSVGDVRAETRRLIDSLSVGGRYILASMHFLMDDVPAENVEAMYDEARIYRPGVN